MLHNLSITDRSDYLLKKNVTKLKRLSTKTKHKEEQEFILPSELENQDKDKIIVNKINSKINPAASIMLEENSAYDFDDLPNHKNVHSNSNSSVASCRKRLSTTQSIKFLSRKDLLHYTKNIPVKVDTTISLHQRSEDYIKLYNKVNLKKKHRKTDIFYWQGLNTQLKKKKKQDAINFNKRLQRFYMDKKSNVKKTETKVTEKNRQRKNRAPSWFLPSGADDNISVKNVQKKERQPFAVRQYEKKQLVTTTWVDGPQVARINAMKAVSNREYMIGLLENHLLRCRVDGILYMDGPKRQFAKYLEIFGKIVEATLTVCEKIKEWREQLHLTAKINYKKNVQIGKTPPFYWTYMRQKKGNAGKIRTTVNYMNKILYDVGDLLLNGMAELVGLLGHKNELLIGPHRANISGNFIKGIRVCPLLLPVPLSEVADGTASPRSLDLKPTSTLEDWSTQAPARWYELEPERVRFAAKYMLAEENHQAQIKSLKVGRLDALSTVLNDRGRNGRGKINKKMSELIAKNVLLTRDFENEEQLNVALNEALIERSIERYKRKLMKARVALNEGIGDEEILARQEAVEKIKLALRNMNKDLDDLKTRTTMVPVIS